MPCWPDLWEHLKGFLPLVGLVASLFAYSALVALLLWAPRLRKRWQRVTSRVLGAAGAGPLLIALPALLLGFALSLGDPPAQTRIVQSLDGRQAKLSYQAGFLGRDYTEVIMKRADCCRHTAVFWHAGPSFFDDPKIEWLDNHHLSITYRTRPGDLQHCERQMGDIAILCVPVPWPDVSPTNQPSSTVPTNSQQ